MLLLITEEHREGGTVQLTAMEWNQLQVQLKAMRGGIDLISSMEPDAPVSGRPVRIRLTRHQLDLLEAAARRVG